jgi:hypothetical protein
LILAGAFFIGWVQDYRVPWLQCSEALPSEVKPQIDLAEGRVILLSFIYFYLLLSPAPLAMLFMSSSHRA